MEPEDCISDFLGRTKCHQPHIVPPLRWRLAGILVLEQSPSRWGSDPWEIGSVPSRIWQTQKEEFNFRTLGLICRAQNVWP